MDYQKDERSFRSLIMDLLEAIIKISSQEYRGGYWTEKIVGQSIERTYVSDTRKQYIQSVQTLKDLLLPHFKKEKIVPIYEKIQKQYELLEDEKIDKVQKGDQNYDAVLYSIKQLKLMQQLFRELNNLLHNSQYLKKQMEFG